MTNLKEQTWANETTDEGSTESSLVYPNDSIDAASFYVVAIVLTNMTTFFLFVLGLRNDAFDDSCMNITSASTGSLPSGDSRSFERERATTSGRSVYMSGSKLISGVSEILGLLGTLGEGYRLSCLYRCQVKLSLVEIQKYSISLLPFIQV